MTIGLIEYDSAEHFRDEKSQTDLLDDALVSGDHRYIAEALGVIARARGMTALGRDTGLKRQQLYRALSDEGNPTLETVTKVLAALHIRLRVEVAPATADPA